MASSDPKKLQELIEGVRDAIACSDDATAAVKRRDKALDHLCGLVHCDRFAAVVKAQQRIGQMMTDGNQITLTPQVELGAEVKRLRAALNEIVDLTILSDSVPQRMALAALRHSAEADSDGE